MLPLPSAWAHETGLPPKARILGFRDSAVLVIHGTGANSLFLHTLVRVRGTSTSFRVLHRRLPLHRQDKGARIWSEAEDRAYRLGHQGSRGMYTPSYHQLRQWISRSYRVRFCYLAYRQRYYLILVHGIHSLLHQS